jgi:hypothetical protein
VRFLSAVGGRKWREWSSAPCSKFLWASVCAGSFLSPPANIHYTPLWCWVPCWCGECKDYGCGGEQNSRVHGKFQCWGKCWVRRTQREEEGKGEPSLAFWGRIWGLHRKIKTRAENERSGEGGTKSQSWLVTWRRRRSN